MAELASTLSLLPNEVAGSGEVDDTGAPVGILHMGVKLMATCGSQGQIMMWLGPQLALVSIAYESSVSRATSGPPLNPFNPVYLISANRWELHGS